MNADRSTVCALLVSAGAALSAVGCERAADRRQTTAPSTTTPSTSTTPSTPTTTTTTTPAPDNSGVNTRDRNAGAVTPIDQGESEADRKVTAEIRKALVGDSAMSVNAQNCKIITREGVVTLRGPVKSQAEKDAIESRAKSVAGVTSVINELEVTTPKP